MKRTATAALLAALSLAGCNDDTIPGSATGVSFDPATLCLSASCGTKTKLLDIASAENMLFTPDGRFFVSGGDNVYEITHPAASWTATPLSATSGNFTGLALRGNVLYAACFDGNLYAGRIDVPTPAIAAIHPLGLAAPNGMTAGPNGELYVVNGPLATNALPDPKIVRITFGADPLTVADQTDWLPLTLVVDSPNGIQRDGNTLYFSESKVLPPALGQINKVEIQADGSPGTVSTFGTLTNLPDDFSLPGSGYVLAALYAGNQVVLLGPGGSTVATSDLLSFDNPSSVRLGQPPLFQPGDVLVTEKGVVGLPPTPGYGNVLSLFRRN